MGLRKCLRCEFNYICDDEKLCDVCSRKRRSDDDDDNSSPKTADASTTADLAVLGVIALGAVVISKKRLSK